MRKLALVFAAAFALAAFAGPALAATVRRGPNAGTKKPPPPPPKKTPPKKK